MMVYFTLGCDPRSSLKGMINETLPEVRVALFVCCFPLRTWIVTYRETNYYREQERKDTKNEKYEVEKNRSESQRCKL